MFSVGQEVDDVIYIASKALSRFSIKTAACESKKTRRRFAAIVPRFSFYLLCGNPGTRLKRSSNCTSMFEVDAILWEGDEWVLYFKPMELSCRHQNARFVVCASMDGLILQSSPFYVRSKMNLTALEPGKTVISSDPSTFNNFQFCIQPKLGEERAESDLCEWLNSLFSFENTELEFEPLDLLCHERFES